MSGNRMVYPLLISLTNIIPEVRSKISLHTYLLLALLPILKFLHKHSCIWSLLYDRLFHRALDEVLALLKTAACVGVMMNDPVGNLQYCYTPLAAYIADTPELSLVACTSPKASPFTTATSTHFGDTVLRPPRTGPHTLSAIHQALEKCSPHDYQAFLRIVKALHLNGIFEPFWVDWLMSCPSQFLHSESLHHFHQFCWDHDVKWCIQVVTAAKIDFRFSLLQPVVGYCGFEDGISKLKQVTGRDHRSIQRYIIGVIAGAVPRQFLIAVHALQDFHYLAQAPIFSNQSLNRLADTLQLFHDNKDAIVQAGGRDNLWAISKLELLQSVASSIHRSGPVMQWSADATEHAHIQEIKVPTQLSNNQNYYDQIAHYLDCSDKCFRFDVAMYFQAQHEKVDLQEDGDADSDWEDEYDIDLDTSSLCDHMNVSPRIVDYFAVADALSHGAIPNAPKPHRTFSTFTTAFHIANKLSLSMTIDEAATLYGIPDLHPAIWEYLQCVQHCTDDYPVSGVRTSDLHCPLPFDHVQIWYKLRVQQFLYHDGNRVDTPQTVRAYPPSRGRSHELHDAVIMSPGPESDWPQAGLEGTIITLLMWSVLC